MAIEVIMPKLGLTMTEGTIITWYKEEGDPVKVGEALFAAETDKVSIDVEATDSGTLLKILVKAGTTIPILGVIGYIGNPGDEIPLLKQDILATTTDLSKTDERITPIPPRTAQGTGDTPISISPLARHLVKENAIDLSGVKGTGPKGRIVEEDIQKILKERKSGINEPIQRNEITVPFEMHLLNQVKRVTARRMTDSFQQTPHFYLNREIDCQLLVELRKKLLTEYENEFHIHLTYTDFILKALALVLPRNALLNASWENEQVRIFKEVHVGLAISTPQGLVVGVVHKAETMSIREIAATRETLTRKAKDGKLTPEDIANGTFTLTNLGMFGVDSFQPIINPPQSAILAAGVLSDRPMVLNGQLVIRPGIILTVALDHRVVDGIEGAAFLKELAEILGQKPETLLN